MNLSSPCIKSAADILGTKWTAQILREFSSSDQRFCELERAIPDINPRTLTKRLDELQSNGIITPIDGAGYNGYKLTPKGHDLLPILEKMAEWGAKYPRDPSWNVA
jgi:DNA-binding HxlR family transcriptional regulator